MAEQDQDRSEHATPYKLEQARKRGSVAKSVDVISLAVLGSGITFLYAMGTSLTRAQLVLDQRVFRDGGRLRFDPESVAQWLNAMLGEAIYGIAPLLLAIVIAAIVANGAQAGAVFSAEPIKPDFDRINPATGFKRVFSMRTVYDAFRNTTKLVLLGGALGLSLWNLVPWLFSLLQYDPVGYPREVIDRASGMLFKLLLVMLVIALLDLLYTRWEFGRKMRMSKRELKDEHKQREGDPRIRAKLRQLRIEMLKRSKALRKLPSADVLITNPTHLAVALSYRHGEMAAPAVIAKGAGDLALRMREVARRHGIPVVENRPLARELFRSVDYDNPVPEELYPKIARILVWVFAMRDAKAQGRAA